MVLWPFLSEHCDGDVPWNDRVLLRDLFLELRPFLSCLFLSYFRNNVLCAVQSLHNCSNLQRVGIGSVRLTEPCASLLGLPPRRLFCQGPRALIPARATSSPRRTTALQYARERNANKHTHNMASMRLHLTFLVDEITSLSSHNGNRAGATHHVSCQQSRPPVIFARSFKDSVSYFMRPTRNTRRGRRLRQISITFTPRSY